MFEFADIAVYGFGFLAPLAGFAAKAFTAKTIGSALISGAGALYKNKQAKDAASKQMAFQKGMSDTAHQREVADLRAAGLNPILSAGGKGASTPGGSTYTPENVGSAGVSGASAATAQQLQRAQVPNVNASTAKTLADARRVELENQAYETLSPSMRALVLSGAGLGGTALATGRAAEVIGRAGRGLGSYIRSGGSNVRKLGDMIPRRRKPLLTIKKR